VPGNFQVFFHERLDLASGHFRPGPAAKITEGLSDGRRGTQLARPRASAEDSTVIQWNDPSPARGDAGAGAPIKEETGRWNLEENQNG
jgi:hypothetical protein